MPTGAQFGIGLSTPRTPTTTRSLRSGPHAPGQFHHRGADAGIRQRGAARHCLQLAYFRYPQRTLGELADGHERPRQRVQRHGQPAGGPGLGRRLRAENADQLPESGGVRAAGRGHVRHAPAQQLQGAGVPGLPNANFVSGTFGRITTMTGDPRIMQFGIKYGFWQRGGRT
jgi:hypothetical protein